MVGLPIMVNAHAPKKIKAEYNTESGILKIEVPHPVKDVNKHFIEEIVVTIDGVETKKSYTAQSSKEAHLVEIEFSGLEKGAIISIYAKCNKLGSKKGELVVE